MDQRSVNVASRQKEVLYLRSPMMDKGYMLILESENPVRLAEFRALGFSTLPQSVRPFLQLDTDTCKGFEFWTRDYNAILAAARNLAERMGLKLEIR